MSKYYGKIGYGQSAEVSPGVWKDGITERSYYGDVTKLTRKLENAEGLNDNITTNNVISIVADPYANDHFFDIRYIEWAGALWKVTNVEVARPRLILTIGGVYHGETA